ncbi:LuxR C-terminal-related transcriptional regulator [Micromonospora sp. SL1-18]|uniref:LuxR C-terminal-related transcriptional regulator n=1 Tax=Micromonospora sp. SL1-18 TaxID=3399128 RepID=UPI003A4DF833
MTARAERRQRASVGRPAKTPPLVGRDDAISRVTSALTRGSALVTVEGEAGIGKTRLLREALAMLANRASPPDRVLIATCPPVPEPAPLGAVVAGIRRLAPNADTHGLSALGGALRPLFPEWSQDLPPALEPLDDSSAVRHVLFRALSELVDRLRVTILVLEDVHWADTATLEWLLTLCADEPAGERDLSIVVSFRPWDVPAGSLLPRLTARTPAGMSRLRIALQPLDIEQIRQLVASMYATDQVSEQFAGFLYGATDGIPLVVEEYLLLLEDRDDITREDDHWTRRVLTELDVPASVRESVLERVHRLDRDTQRLLEAASILMDPADEPLLATVADLDESAARSGVARALASGLLCERSAGRFTFRHVLDAQAISGAMPVSERRRMHERAARALRRKDHPPMARLAHHFREAGDDDQWCGYAEASAELALESGDDRTAVETLLQVMNAAEHPISRRVRLARQLGQAAFFGAAALGDLAEHVVDVLRRVLDSGEIAQADRGELRLLLGRMLWAIGERSASFEQWESAVPDLGHRPDLAIRAMANMVPPLIPDWPVSRHRHWLDRAGELLDQVATKDRRAFLDMRMTALLLLGEEAGWEALGDLPRSAPTQAGERDLANTRVNAVWAMLAWGRFDGAREQLAVCRRHIEATDSSRLTHLALAVQARLDWYVGNWSGLDASVAELAGREDTDAESKLHARQVRGLLKLAAGGRSAAQRELHEVALEQTRLGVMEPEAVAVPAALARLHLADGDSAQALSNTSPVVHLIARKGVWLWITDIAPVHVDALLGTAKGDDVDDFVAAFAHEVAGRNLPAPAAALVTCQAIVALAAGDPRRAAGLFADAARRWAALPRPYDELLSRERQGRALLAAGERAGALELLVDTQQRLHDLGARWDADRVAHVVRDHGGEVARAWRGGRRGYGDRLSPRELDVVGLVARGMTNRQAAEALFLSPRTVEAHVKSAMRKLGVKSRTALAIAAVEAGFIAADGKDSTGRG